MKKHSKNLSLNQVGVNYAHQLIEKGRVNTGRNNWAKNKPTFESENMFLSDHDMNEYGQWFLAIVDDTNLNVKNHYEFPFGDFKKIFRSALIAAKQRASQFKHVNIERAAGILLDALEKR